MTINWSPLYTLNFFLCLVIMILGILAFVIHKNKLALNIALAFALFSISHLMGLLGLGKSWESALLAIRTFAYLFVILALCTSTFNNNKRNNSEHR